MVKRAKIMEQPHASDGHKSNNLSNPDHAQFDNQNNPSKSQNHFLVNLIKVYEFLIYHRQMNNFLTVRIFGSAFSQRWFDVMRRNDADLMPTACCVLSWLNGLASFEMNTKLSFKNNKMRESWAVYRYVCTPNYLFVLFDVLGEGVYNL